MTITGGHELGGPLPRRGIAGPQCIGGGCGKTSDVHRGAAADLHDGRAAASAESQKRIHAHRPEGRHEVSWVAHHGGHPHSRQERIAAPTIGLRDVGIRPAAPQAGGGIRETAIPTDAEAAAIEAPAGAAERLIRTGGRPRPDARIHCHWATHRLGRMTGVCIGVVRNEQHHDRHDSADCHPKTHARRHPIPSPVELPSYRPRLYPLTRLPPLPAPACPASNGVWPPASPGSKRRTGSRIS